MVGKMLGNRYEILAKLGSGGMANVYQARCTILNRIVTVKVLRQELAEDKDFVKRFQLEAQAVARLSHPNIVSIYDVGEENGLPYLVMEYVEGSNLKEIISRQGPLSPAETVNIGIQVCAALAHAHDKGIVHRDIKPHNILVTPGGRVKVTDFGLARFLSLPGITMAQSGTVMGSVHYFSPEQARGEEATPRSDIYALGAVLYETVSGEVPFSGENPVSVAIKHLQEDPMPLRSKNPAIPASLEAIIFKAMARNPEERFTSAREMQQALAGGWEAGDNDQTRVLSLDKERETVRPIIKRKHRAGRWIALALLLLALVGGGAWWGSALLFPGEVTVPSLMKMSDDLAQQRIRAAGLTLTATHQGYSSDVPAGLVYKQSPLPGSKVRKGSGVEIWISRGARLVFLPNVVGMPEADAKILIENNGDFPIKETYDYSETVPAGSVISQSPAGDARIREGRTVTLVISKGPIPKQTMPSLVGMTLDQAKSELESLSLKLGTVSTQSSDQYAEGIIIGQSVPEGSSVAPGTTVDLVQSQGLSQPKVQTLDFRVKDTGEVKVVIQDAQGTRVAVQQVCQAGDRFKKDFSVYPPGQIVVFFQGQPIKTVPVD